jgi:hypothetical protein
MVESAIAIGYNWLKVFLENYISVGAMRCDDAGWINSIEILFTFAYKLESKRISKEMV